MNWNILVLMAACCSTGALGAAEVPAPPAVASAQAGAPASPGVERAAVIAETRRAIARGDLHAGPLADYLAQFAPAAAPPSTPAPLAPGPRDVAQAERTVIGGGSGMAAAGNASAALEPVAPPRQK